MNTIKKYMKVGLILIAFPLATQAQNKDFKAYCENMGQQGHVGLVNIGTTHGFTIINKTPLTQIYHVSFDNAVQHGKTREIPLDYTDSPFTPNAHMEYDIKVENGQTYYFGPVLNSKLANFAKKGSYRTQAITMIKLGNEILDKCEHIGVAHIT